MFWSAFGVLFDPEEGRDSIQRKIHDLNKNNRPENPYRAVLKSDEGADVEINDCGEVTVESWLSIYPVKDDLVMFTSTNFGIFWIQTNAESIKTGSANMSRILKGP